MAGSPIKFGTSGWRGIIADDFTFPNVRIAVAAIAEHVLSRKRTPTLLVAHDTRFFSEEFARTAAVELVVPRRRAFALRRSDAHAGRGLRDSPPQDRRRHQFHRQP